jgi:amidase
MSSLDLDICYLSASEALEKFKNKSLSPVELLNETIKRIENVNPKINAFNFFRFEEALKEAKKSELKYTEDKSTLPLEGLPLAIKDEVNVKGHPNKNGSLIYKDVIAEKTDVDVESLVSSGAIIHARTTNPEFSLTSFCHSKVNGVTRNPWNLDMTPGGSSGGSAAALASGCASLATGSDIGGSIRIPAGACGVVGYKPPYGRNPMGYPFNHDPYCVVGPLARTVSDCALMQNVMSGPNKNDIASLRPKKIIPNKFESIKDWKIAYSLDLGFFEVDEEVEKNTLEALKKFEALGATITEVKLNWNRDEVNSVCFSHYANSFYGLIAKFSNDEKKLLTDYAKMFAEVPELHLKAIQNNEKHYHDKIGAYVGYDTIESAEITGRMYSEIGPILDSYDLFICPTNSLPSIKADIDIVNENIIINNKEQKCADFSWVMSHPFNMLGKLPVLSVPSGLSSDNIPTGIQIIARSYCDELVFQGGHNYEMLDPWLNSNKNRPLIHL